MKKALSFSGIINLFGYPGNVYCKAGDTHSFLSTFACEYHGYVTSFDLHEEDHPDLLEQWENEWDTGTDRSSGPLGFTIEFSFICIDDNKVVIKEEAIKSLKSFLEIECEYALNTDIDEVPWSFYLWQDNPIIWTR